MKRLILLLALLFAAPAQAQPLVLAAERGDVAALRQLLASGTPVDQRDGRGRTALLAATHENRIEAARLLIAAGAFFVFRS